MFSKFSNILHQAVEAVSEFDVLKILFEQGFLFNFFYVKKSEKHQRKILTTLT
jgi:hypothetical protein